MPGWLTADDVAGYLHVSSPRQPDLDQITAAVVAEVERIRSDLDFITAPPSQMNRYANIWMGTLLWAVDLYQVRLSPNGYPNYGEPGADLYGAIDATRWVTISRLCGLRRPLTA